MIMPREIRQMEAANIWLMSDRIQIINACPRFGKTHVAGLILKQITPPKLLILYPRHEIRTGWESTLALYEGYYGSIEWCTFKSAHKLVGNDYDLIIWDEPQEASLNQLITINNVIAGSDVLGLTGTLTNKSRDDIFQHTSIDVCYEYSISDGVRDGILADYEIVVHLVDLEGSESRKYQKLVRLKNNLKKDGKPNYFADLKIINLLQNSITKQKKTQQLLDSYKGERVLVFSGVTEIADGLGIPTYHSKSKEKSILDDFCNGKIEKLSTINMLQTGITITPIEKAIVNYTSGNPETSAQKICRMLGYEYVGKKSHIDVICSNTEFEKGRIKTALSFFKESKIKYI